jgi:dipeptidase D
MKNETVRNLEPKALWNHFAEINAIPRASKKEEQIVAYMVSFGKGLGLETIVDPVGNVIIRKPATPGMENRKSIVLQSHLDMVHQKNEETNFDFDTEGIKMIVDGDWVKADGTTLGADNGIGVAAIMAVLSSDGIAHPDIEALFTIDEETGMTGAQGLQAGYLHGEILLNLDTEEDDEIDIGCAGGIDVTATKTYEAEFIPIGVQAYKISIKGLQGGHSGMDIHKGFGNANKLMNQILTHLDSIIQISALKGGGLRNAIPRESSAVIVCDQKNSESVLRKCKDIFKSINQAYKAIEPKLIFSIEATDLPVNMMPRDDQSQLLNAIEGAINGVFKMSEDMEDLVEASNNIARVIVDNGAVSIACLTRSSVEESKKEVAESLKNVFEKEEFKVTFSGSYPGWSPNPNSAILKVLEALYFDLYNSKPAVVACHAGLECGLLGTHYPDMDMISFGPTIKGAHSPDERASISSIKRFWAFLQEILKNIPLKN